MRTIRRWKVSSLTGGVIAASILSGGATAGAQDTPNTFAIRLASSTQDPAYAHDAYNAANTFPLRAQAIESFAGCIAEQQPPPPNAYEGALNSEFFTNLEAWGQDALAKLAWGGTCATGDTPSSLATACTRWAAVEQAISQISYAGAGGIHLGTSVSALDGAVYRQGELESGMKELIPILYKYGSEVPWAIPNLFHVLFLEFGFPTPLEGCANLHTPPTPVEASSCPTGAPGTSGYAPPTYPIGSGTSPETENHVLLTLSTQYLVLLYNNGLPFCSSNPPVAPPASCTTISSPGTAACKGYDVDPTVVHDTLMAMIRGILTSDFFEYNAKSYQHYALYAMENLVDFAPFNSDIATAARMVLDYSAAKFATSSSYLRRTDPFRRRADDDSNYFSGNNEDAQVCRFLLYSGELDGFSTGSGYAADLSCAWATREAIGTYRVPPAILDLAYTSIYTAADHANSTSYPYIQTFSGGPSYYGNLFDLANPGSVNLGDPLPGSTEIYDHERTFMIAGGGTEEPNGLPAYGLESFIGNLFPISNTISNGNILYSTSNEDTGLSQPIVLLPNDSLIGPQMDRSKLVRIAGSPAEADENLCVAPGFACGKNPTMPAASDLYYYEIDGDWQFAVVASVPVYTYVAMLASNVWLISPAAAVPGVTAPIAAPYQVGLFEAEAADQFPDGFPQFKTTVMQNNPQGSGLIQEQDAPGGAGPPAETLCPFGGPVDAPTDCLETAGWKGTYTRTDGTMLTFSIPTEEQIFVGVASSPFTNYPVESLSSSLVLPLQDTSTWGLADGVGNPVVANHAGLITITNTRINRQCILDITDIAHPTRTHCDDAASPPAPYSPPPEGDFDNDGVPNFQDNCPLVANADQHNTNFVAEYQLQLNAGCAPVYPSICPTNNGLKPTDWTDQTYSQYFQAVYPGDVCDKTASTDATWAPTETPVAAGATSCEQSAACSCCAITVVSGQSTSSAGCGTPNENNCGSVNATTLDLYSWMSNGNGGGRVAQGGSAPAFCSCNAFTLGDPRSLKACTSNTAFDCPIAKEGAFPTQGLMYNPFINGGWNEITEYPSAGALSSNQPPESQERFGCFFVPGQSSNQCSNLSEIVWDVAGDLATFGQSNSSSLTGVLWTAVRDFTPDLASGEVVSDTPDRINLRHHYDGITTSQASSSALMFPLQNFSMEQYFGPSVLFVPWGNWVPAGALPIARSSDLSVPFLALSTQGDVAFPYSEDTTRTHVAQSVFSADALALLAQAAQGKADLIVGDDVTWGQPAGFDLYPIVVVQAGTSNILGGLHVSGRTVSTSQPPAVGKVPDPPDARAYDAFDGRLYSLHLSEGGALLQSVDVAGAVEGMTTMQAVRVSGVVPQAPLAMVWSKGDKSLYVLDGSTHAGRKTLILIRIATSGDSTEVWRTVPTGHALRAFLSAGYGNDLVVALTTQQGSEVAVLSPDGSPLYSAHVDGRFQGPAIESAAGLTLPMLRDSGGENSNLNLRFVSRANLTTGICDGRWMRAHAWSRLGATCGACRDRLGWGGGD